MHDVHLLVEKLHSFEDGHGDGSNHILGDSLMASIEPFQGTSIHILETNVYGGMIVEGTEKLDNIGRSSLGKDVDFCHDLFDGLVGDFQPDILGHG